MFKISSQDHPHRPLSTSFALRGSVAPLGLLTVILASSTPWPGERSGQGESPREKSSASGTCRAPFWGAQKTGAAEDTAVGRAGGAFVKQAVNILWAELSRSQHAEGQWRHLGMGVALNFCPNREALLSNWQPARL